MVRVWHIHKLLFVVQVSLTCQTLTRINGGTSELERLGSAVRGNQTCHCFTNCKSKELYIDNRKFIENFEVIEAKMFTLM